MGEQATQTYSLKDTTRRLNANIHRYTQDQLTWIKWKMKEVLYYFGYAQLPGYPENPTGFFDYSNEFSKDEPEFKGWHAFNEDMIQWVCRIENGEEEACSYQFNAAPEKKINVLGDQRKNFLAILNYYNKKIYGIEPEYLD